MPHTSFLQLCFQQQSLRKGGLVTSFYYTAQVSNILGSLCTNHRVLSACFLIPSEEIRWRTNFLTLVPASGTEDNPAVATVRVWIWKTPRPIPALQTLSQIPATHFLPQELKTNTLNKHTLGTNLHKRLPKKIWIFISEHLTACLSWGFWAPED